MKNNCLICNHSDLCKMTMHIGAVSYPAIIPVVFERTQEHLLHKYKGLSIEDAIINIIKNAKITRHCYLAYTSAIYEDIKSYNGIKNVIQECAIKGINDVLYFVFGKPVNNDNELRKIITENRKNNETKKDKEYLDNLQDELGNTTDKTEREVMIKTRVGHGRFKDKLSKLHGCKCQICGLQNEELLIGSHSKPWALSSNNERLNEYNGVLICTGQEALYDKGFISFQDDGSIMISIQLDEKAAEKLNINENIKIKVYEENKQFLKYHRENIFRK